MIHPNFKRLLTIQLITLVGLALLVTLWGSITVEKPLEAAGSACTVPPTPANPSKVGFYVLAFDNDPLGMYDLGSKYDATVARLVSATANVPNSVIVILADLGEVGDTHLIVASGGSQTRLDCLPRSNGSLDPSQTEWDVADGDNLANFLLWGRAEFAASAGDLVFSYIGHGNPVTPYTEPGINALVPPAADGQLDLQQTASPQALSPLPSRLGVNPSFTDHHAPTTGTLSLITPNALATALAAATDDGAFRFTVVDLLHCFAASIDELTEIAPYAAGIVASPNYAFYDPEMPGATFEQDVFENVVLKYGNFHPNSGHPHLIMGIEGDTLNAILTSWETVTAELINEFDSDQAATADRLSTAYLNSVKYDTTVCESDQDWALEPPDALSDMKSFAAELQTAFAGQNPNLTTALSQTINNLDGSILSTESQSGIPYFDDGAGNSWNFLPGESGVSLFTPFQTTLINGEPYLPWQSLWYTGTARYELTGSVVISNPRPFAFIAPSTQPTWADVVARFWSAEGIRPGVDVNTFFCTAELLGMSVDAADLSVQLDPPTSPIERGESFQVTLTVTNTGVSTATNPRLFFAPHAAQVSGLSFESSQPDGICSKSGQEVLCQLNDLGVDQTSTVTLTYNTAEDEQAPLLTLQMETNVTADTFDAILADNRQTAQLEVRPTAAKVFLPLVRAAD